jgi:hypothetical protein
MLMNDFLAEKFGEDEIRELGPAGFKTVGSDWSGK